MNYTKQATDVSIKDFYALPFGLCSKELLSNTKIFIPLLRLHRLYKPITDRAFELNMQYRPYEGVSTVHACREFTTPKVEKVDISAT